MAFFSPGVSSEGALEQVRRLVSNEAAESGATCRGLIFLTPGVSTHPFVFGSGHEGTPSLDVTSLHKHTKHTSGFTQVQAVQVEVCKMTNESRPELLFVWNFFEG